jgi:hypothetical protein
MFMPQEVGLDVVKVSGIAGSKLDSRVLYCTRLRSG